MNELKVSHIRSDRLRLVPATLELTDADLAGRTALEQALGVAVPAEWPPELHSPQSLQIVRAQLRDRASHGWTTWYLVGDDGGVATLVGVCGFKGRPDDRGSVEIAYSLLPAYRRHGLASEAVGRLVDWAFSHPRVSEVAAETMPHLSRSIAVLRRNGFVPAGRGSEYGVVRYVITRRNLA